MQQINIQAIPNQSFTVNIGEYRYDITLKFIQGGVMSYDIFIDELPVVQGFRIQAGQLMLPYRYQEVDGNFFMSLPDGVDPDYNQFGENQLLFYLTASEAEAVRNGN